MSAIFTTWSKPEVYLHHTPYFRIEMLAFILEFSLYHCYYSQNHSSINIAGLWRSHVLKVPLEHLLRKQQKRN